MADGIQFSTHFLSVSLLSESPGCNRGVSAVAPSNRGLSLLPDSCPERTAGGLGQSYLQRLDELLHLSRQFSSKPLDDRSGLE